MSHRYDDELSRFSRLYMEAGTSTMNRGLAEFQRDFQILSNLYVALRFLVDQRNVNLAPAAIRVLFAKLIDCLMGVNVLLRSGLPGPAAMMLRSLFETSVHLQVLLKSDIPDRCKLFEDFIYVQRSRVSPQSGVPKSQIRENKKKLAAVRANYHPRQPYSWCWKIVPGRLGGTKISGNASLRNFLIHIFSWCLDFVSGNLGREKIPRNPSLRDLCIHIGHEEYYKNIYGLLSDVIHPVMSYEMWMRRADLHMELGPKFNQHTKLVGHLASVLTVDVVMCLLGFLKPPDELELKRLFVTQII